MLIAYHLIYCSTKLVCLLLPIRNYRGCFANLSISVYKFLRKEGWQHGSVGKGVNRLATRPDNLGPSGKEITDSHTYDLHPKYVVTDFCCAILGILKEESRDGNLWVSDFSGYSRGL